MKFKRHSQRTINKGYKHNERGFGQWLRIVAIIVFLLFIVRFGSIAIFKDVKNHDLKSAAQQRYTQSQFVRARRGKITDAQGNILAEDSNTYTVYAVLDHQQKDKDGKPKYVANKRKTARILSGYLDMSEDKIYKDLNPSKKVFFRYNSVRMAAIFPLIRWKKSRVATCQELNSSKIQLVNILRATLHDN